MDGTSFQLLFLIPIALFLIGVILIIIGLGRNNLQQFKRAFFIYFIGSLLALFVSLVIKSAGANTFLDRETGMVFTISFYGLGAFSIIGVLWYNTTNVVPPFFIRVCLIFSLSAIGTGGYSTIVGSIEKPKNTVKKASVEIKSLESEQSSSDGSPPIPTE